jgi:DNA-binding protein H-NS
METRLSCRAKAPFGVVSEHQEISMSIKLGAMSRAELLTLRDDVEKALVAAEKRDRAEALKAAQKAAAEFGFDLDELSGKQAAGKAKKTRAKAAAKYRNPKNAEQTWSGRGRKPQWIHDALSAGHDINDLEI